MEQANEFKYEDEYMNHYNDLYTKLGTTKPKKEREDPLASWKRSNEEFSMLNYRQDKEEDEFEEQLVKNYGTTSSGNSFKDELVALESGGDYTAHNESGGGSGAVGKYQFRWNLHHDKINDYAGKNVGINEFLNSPKLQDGFFNDYWMPKVLMPEVSKLKRLLSKAIPDSNLGKLIHFRGYQGAIDYLSGKLSDKPESYNMSISKYTGIQPGKYIGRTGGIPYSGISNQMYTPNISDYYNNNIQYSNYFEKEFPKYDVMNKQLPSNEDTTTKTDEVTKRLTGALDLIENAVDFKNNFNSMLGQGVSQGASAADSILSNINNQYLSYEALEDSSIEKSSNYYNLLNLQNKQKTLLTG